MCGIVGIIGRQPAAPLLLEALKRLEYRGYDSAGIATLVDGRIERRRAEGKLVNLEAVLEREPLAGVTGIGHTRWATHGPPTRDNAHPHEAGGVAVVHNGIIENFETLRDELTRAGHTVHDPDRHRGRAAAGQRLSGPGHEPGAGGRGGARAPARRLRPGAAVRRPRRPSGLRAARQPARDRLWRGRDVRRLRCPGARPADRSHPVPRGGRLGGGHAARRHDLRQRRRTRRSGRSPRRRSRAP